MRKAGLLLVVLCSLLGSIVAAQEENGVPIVNLEASAGYNGLFRENTWFPLRIRISNNGDAVSGRLAVRPETSGNAFTNTFSTPVELPSGSQQTVFLYITARGFASQVRVELLDQADQVIAVDDVPLRGIVLQDQLHIVLTQSSAGSVDLSDIHAGGFNAFQSNWLIDNLPDQVMGLQAVDTLFFSDIDTGTLSLAQRTAISDWVLSGGHLIVTGGANWQATASGLADLLPLLPDASRTVSDLSAVAALANSQANLQGETIVAIGTLIDDAQVLAAAGDLPLVIRREYGLGTVDYLAVDPITEPLRAWPGLNGLWFTLSSSVGMLPGWTGGFTDFDRATSAAEILPGFDLLPNVLPLCGFLALYVALIGPLNYFVLNRINRREFAWLTIPLFIVLFSVLAWGVGFNLRGNIATLSRLAVVQSWADSDRAQVDGLIGLLSPRRTNYTLTLADGGFLRPIGRSIQSNPFVSNVQASTDIRQSDRFRAEDFLVDASFIATFAASTTTEKPAISGQASLFYDATSGQWMVRGSVRNDSTESLNQPVILARGAPLHLDGVLEPGDVRTFDMILGTTSQPAAPSPLERNLSVLVPRFGFQRFSQDIRATELTVVDILGSEIYDTRAYLGLGRGSPSATMQEERRRQFFLSSFITDQYFATARGDRVFLVGWTDSMPLQTDLANAQWESVDTTLHLIELGIERNLPVGEVRIGMDQFTWVAVERGGMTDSLAPVNTVLQPGDLVAFRFTPLPHLVLNEVNQLRLVADSPATLRSAILVDLWNWDSETWETVELSASEDMPNIATFTPGDASPYLGAQNAVQIRLITDETTPIERFVRLGIEQLGRF